VTRRAGLSGSSATIAVGLGLLAVVGVVVALLVLLGVLGVHAVGSVLGGREDRTSTVSGEWNGARTTADGRGLRIQVTGSAPYVAGDPCTSDLSGSANETEQQVRVTIRARQPEVHRAYDCSAVGYLRWIEVGLGSPLGDRAVVDEGDGSVEPVFDGSTLLEPRSLPDGWAMLAESAGQPDPQAATSWTRTWGPPAPAPAGGACVAGPSAISVTQGPTGLVDEMLPRPGPIGTVAVAGTPATIRAGVFGSGPTLWWVRGDVGLVIGATSRCGDDGPVSVDQLVAFAESLH